MPPVPKLRTVLACLALMALVASPATGLACDSGSGDPPPAKVKGKGR
ncbi:hypothetical protein KBY66_12755 [Synechococcus sp. Tobar12-5m-g]|nr:MULTISPECIES: hypothetical protein [unclassified Synechococcus]MCP9773474.1 hypothetical protein [Synechococcus sp. Tobar12-5m-g]MCP9874468.1 hypothetical protein [Synechococcus sp. Cruz CV-v-12]